MVLERNSSAPSRTIAQDGPSLVTARQGAVSVWAVAGVLWIVFVAQAWGRWITSDTLFTPAPIYGPDTFDGAALVVLRVIEAVSILIVAATVWVSSTRSPGTRTP